MQAWAWFAIAGVCAALEVLNLSLVFASFSLGALAAALARLATTNVAVPWIVFAVATVLSLRLKPIVTRYIFRKTPKSDTGILALIGSKATAITAISESGGTINLKHEVWTARTHGGEIPAGSDVTVQSIDGAVAVVVLRS
jgi:membrane protein implicated in regulation of membrane protease activity